MTRPAIQLDFFADPTCPWCYVGFHALQAARAKSVFETTLHWRPFLLRPDAPAEGVDRQAFYGKLAAADPQRFAASSAALAEAVAGLGLAPLSTEKPNRLPNAINVQRVLFWAAPRGAQEPLAAHVLNAYWRDGEDIGDARVLADLAGAAGLDRAIIADLLAGDADQDRILTLHTMAMRSGVTGVPLVVKDGRTGIMGAQTVAQYQTFLTAD